MLDTTNNKSKRKRRPSRKRKARQHRERQARHLVRVCAGIRCATVQYGPNAIDCLVKLGRLPVAADFHGKAAIDAAINTLWNDVVDVLLDDRRTLDALMEDAAKTSATVAEVGPC